MRFAIVRIDPTGMTPVIQTDNEVLAREFAKELDGKHILLEQKATRLFQSIDETWDRVSEWQVKTFGSAATYRGAIEHLRQEAKELHDDPTHPEAGEELADIFFMLVQAMSLGGFDPVTVVTEKLRKNEKRKWAKPDKDGVINHV